MFGTKSLSISTLWYQFVCFNQYSSRKGDKNSLYKHILHFLHLHLRFFFIIAFHEFFYDASPHFIYLFLEFWVFLKSMAWHLSIDLENSLALSFQILFFPFFLFSTGTSVNCVRTFQCIFLEWFYSVHPFVFSCF